SSAIPVAIEIPRGQSLAIFDTFRVQRASLRRRPTLMSPSSSPPTVGYLYAATCFLIFLAIAPLQLSIFRRDLGIPVRVIRPEVMMRPSGDQEITGLLVYVDRNDNLYLNSKPMTAAELPGALEDEFARRADWSVYVEGDPDLAYGTVIHAMDLVRGAHGKVILLTPGMRAEAEARHP
ncbi:MAG TPA: biopolymer transporter ExbD, partial [Candidatus Acidoferrales bacterium]|nr:biopolymer transporter ExbD [Candidatus Acidoferrales bacterium]